MYGDDHKYFLQFIFKHGHVPVEKALDFCKNLTEEITDLDGVKTLVLETNQKINQHELRIATTTCEITGTVSFTLLNTASDDVCKLQNSYSPIETEYFQQLLKEIVTADGHKIRSIACYNLTDTLTGHLRKDSAEVLLNKWLQQGYLVEKDSYVYLGPRCIAEFATYFRSHCKDYYTACFLCSEPVFSGRACSSCNKVTHGHCIEKYLRRQKLCPNCKEPWIEGTLETNSSTEEEEIAEIY